MSQSIKVAVTGVSGFIAQWVVVLLLKAGYTVHGTVRSLQNESRIHSALIRGGVETSVVNSKLRLFPADLLSDDGWPEAFKDCTHLLHLASPFPLSEPKDEDELIRPAVEGTTRVLKYAEASGTIKRVVVTSSEAAIHFGLPQPLQPFDESNWTDVNNKSVNAYQKSKTLAERAAWKFWEDQGKAAGMTLATVNPSAVFGPALGQDLGSSLTIIKNAIQGQMSYVPRVAINVVDVRDVAELHVRAMEAASEKVDGQRFVCSIEGAIPLKEVVLLVKGALVKEGALAKAEAIKEPHELPDMLFKLTSFVSPTARRVAGMIGKVPTMSHDNATKRLNWKPRKITDVINETVSSLVTTGVA